MVDASPCSACGHVNAVAADTCAACGEPLPLAGVRARPGDRDDVSVPGPPAAGDDDESDAVALRIVAERLRRARCAAETETAAHRAAGTRPAHYAGFVVRFVAFAIDLVVLAAFAVPLTAAGLYGIKIGLVLSGTTVELSQTEEAIGRLVAWAWLAMALVYFTTLHSGGGQTIGKAVVGIAVRRARDLARIGILRSFLRALAYALSTGLFFMGFLTIILAPRKRGWHDYLAGTCVVHLAPEEV